MSAIQCIQPQRNDSLIKFGEYNLIKLAENEGK